MWITWLFFLGAIVLTAIIVMYTRKNGQEVQAVRHEPELGSREEKTKDKNALIDHDQEEDLGLDNKQSSHRSERGIIILHVLATQGLEYAGYELLQALLSNNLRFGKMNIFHRYEKTDNTGDILFSVASVKEPGTFEMSKMGGFSTPGLVLFLRLGIIRDPMHAFEVMLFTAAQLLEDLGGELLDDRLQPLTE